MLRRVENGSRIRRNNSYKVLTDRKRSRFSRRLGTHYRFSRLRVRYDFWKSYSSVKANVDIKDGELAKPESTDSGKFLRKLYRDLGWFTGSCFSWVCFLSHYFLPRLKNPIRSLCVRCFPNRFRPLPSRMRRTGDGVCSALSESFRTVRFCERGTKSEKERKEISACAYAKENSIYDLTAADAVGLMAD